MIITLKIRILSKSAENEKQPLQAIWQFISKFRPNCATSWNLLYRKVNQNKQRLYVEG